MKKTCSASLYWQRSWFQDQFLTLNYQILVQVLSNIQYMLDLRLEGDNNGVWRTGCWVWPIAAFSHPYCGRGPQLVMYYLICEWGPELCAFQVKFQWQYNDQGGKPAWLIFTALSPSELCITHQLFSSLLKDLMGHWSDPHKLPHKPPTPL